jgi:hypothetical protein
MGTRSGGGGGEGRGGVYRPPLVKMEPIETTVFTSENVSLKVKQRKIEQNFIAKLY